MFKDAFFAYPKSQFKALVAMILLYTINTVFTPIKTCKRLELSRVVGRRWFDILIWEKMSAPIRASKIELSLIMTNWIDLS
jgi:hypothetical protein